MAKKAKQAPKQAAASKEPGCISCCCILKYVFSPFIILWHAIRIYIFGCFVAYAERFGRGVFCGLCVCCNCTFQDKRFPHDHRSIGEYKGQKGPAIDDIIIWRRIGEVCTAPGTQPVKPKDGESSKGLKAPTTHLFSGEIEPADICQGEVGDCWLMSALACLSTKPGAIQQVFVTREYNMYGKYKLRLYNGQRKKWQTVVVDDYVPCKKSDGRPVFAKPNGDEAWVLLLEKAMAKFLGGNYAALDGNLMIKALECLTGDFVCLFALADPKDAESQGKPPEQQRWTRLELPKPKPPPVDKKGNAAKEPDNKAPVSAEMKLVYAKDTPFDHDLMFRSVKYELKEYSTIGASNAGGASDTENINGIVQGHAYAVIEAEEVENKRFLKLRNPWGKFEWTGNWSDKSPLWDQNPKIKAALKFTAADDGMFWMEWVDFVRHFNTLEFCCRSTGFDHVVLDIHEEHPCCGPCWGCIEGCTKYWFCCLGVRALCCGRTVKEFKRPPSGCCGCIN